MVSYGYTKAWFTATTTIWGPIQETVPGGGTLAHFGVCTDEELKRPVTASDINTALAKHVHKVERYIRRKVPHHRLTQAQFDGLASFIYNVSDPSAVMEAVDHGDMTAVHDKMLQYIYVFKHDAKGRKVGKPKILAPLYKRRLEETAPFGQE